MDDPIFDPWSVDTEESASESAPPPTSPRWRSPVRAGPVVPPPQVPPRSLGPAPVARLRGAEGFLRAVAVPTLEEIAGRLRVARHSAAVLDRLAETPAVVRLSMRPWRGPPSGDPAAPIATLELALEAGGEHLVAQVSGDGDSGPPGHDRSRIPVGELDTARIERLASEFIARVLAGA